jgi:hypothetical protein
MGRLANSWQTTKSSWHVLKKDKELILFPVFSGIASLIVIASFVAPTWFAGIISRAVEQEDPNAQTILFFVYAVMYLVLAFVTIYFNAALIYGATERLKGGDPTIKSALRGANSRLGKIFAWAMFAGTVSLLIHLLERATRGRGGAGNLAANIVVRLVGVAWTLATFFAIPIVLYEDRGVIGSLKRSGQLFKQRWGESVIGQYGISFVFGLISFGVILLTVLLMALAMQAGVFGFVVGLAILVAGLILFVLVNIVGLAMGSVYKAALYRFATQGELPPEFPRQSIEDAFRPTAHPL